MLNLILAFLISWCINGYLTFNRILYFLSQKERVESRYEPKVSVIIPTYNEEEYIERRIKNILEQEYKNLEIIVVDSGSTDRTREIVRRFENVRLVVEGKRRGKASALNKAVKLASGEIVVTTDANTLFSRNCIKELVKHFSDEKVGMVVGGFTPENKNSPESVYWVMEREILRGENLLNRVSTAFGSVTAVRKELAVFDESCEAEDFALLLSVRSRGYRVVFEEKAVGVEKVADSLKDVLKVKRRIALGVIRALSRKKRFILDFSVFSHRVLPLILPFLLILFLLTMDLRSFLFLIFLLLFFYPLDLKKPKVSFKKLFLYMLVVNVAVLLAWFDFVTGKSKIKWEKVR